MVAPPLPKVFVSYNSADRTWAEWIAWQIEDAGEYTAVIQAWDFGAGSNFILKMQEAAKDCQRTIAVLSDAYLAANFPAPEWAAAFRVDPTGKNQTLVPVRVAPCKPEGLLGSLVYIDLVGLNEAASRLRLLDGLKLGRVKPATPPAFPGAASVPAVPPKSAKPAFPPSLPRYWNVPAHNPFFTGRDELLDDLHAELSGQRRAILSGMGGIGKTQTAIAYAHRHRDAFPAVFFLRADTETNLIAGFVEIAGLLGLPEREAQDQGLAVAAVQRWLGENAGWLLIADNADDLPLARRFLPHDAPGGCLLLTSRESATRSFAPPRKVLPLDLDPGARLLLQRAGRLALGAPLETVAAGDLDAARALSRELGGLPLALEQAGAFIEEMPSSPAGYLSLYQHEKHAPRLRAWRSEVSTPEHETVAVTFTLAFERVAAANPAAADLLRLCAFLAPDDLPETALSDGAPALPEPLASALADDFRRRETIRAATRFSLLHCDPDNQSLSLHRQVGEVLRDRMNEQRETSVWAERAIGWTAEAFPNPEEFAHWPRCEALLPHALACARLLKEENSITEGWLANRVGSYLRSRAHYTEAGPLIERALAIYERELGESHPDSASILNNLALLHHAQGKLAEAEPLFERALAIYERELGESHPDTATSLNNLTLIHQDQGKLAKAEPLLKRVLAIRERALGEGHPDTAANLNNLAALYYAQGKLAKAGPLLKRALAIRERELGESHPDSAISLNNLAELYRAQGKLAEAGPLLKRALAIRERVLGESHPDTATSLNNLALLHHAQGKLAEAEPLFERALAICERTLGTEHLNVAKALGNLALLYGEMGREAEATAFSSRAKASREAHARRNARK